MSLDLVKKYRNGNDVAGLIIILVYCLPLFVIYPGLKNSVDMNALNLSFAAFILNTAFWLGVLQFRKIAEKVAEDDERGDGVDVQEVRT